MTESLTHITQIFTGITLYDFLKAIILILLGFFFAKICSAALSKALTKFTSTTHTQIAYRICYYLILTLFLIAALQHLGFKLNVLLGAAGILTVALGFASQTSVSNIISGLFLIAEKPFIVGDSIKIDSNTIGEVLSIDLLSIKIRTPDNTLIRIPNETLIKTNVINLTRFPIRRFDLQLGVGYQENLDTIKQLLFSLAEKNPLCLEEPKPSLYILGFGDSAINLQFSVWAAKKHFTELKNSIQEEVKEAFATHNIEMPFPQLTISAANNTSAFPVELTK